MSLGLSKMFSKIYHSRFCSYKLDLSRLNTESGDIIYLFPIDKVVILNALLAPPQLISIMSTDTTDTTVTNKSIYL